MHRLLMGCATGAFVDHINRDRLDNRRNNLRVCTPAQNLMNKKQTSNNPYKGVCHTYGAWRTQICFHGRCIYLGRFQDPVTAAKSYDGAARILYGEYAFLNFPNLDAKAITLIKKHRKLSLTDAENIRHLYKHGISITDIAQIYNHSYSSINKVVKGKTFCEKQENE